MKAKKQRKGNGDVEIGRRIRKIRKEKGLTQVQLAEMVLVSGSSITRLEKGETMVSVFTLRAIAKVLDVPVSWLLEEEGQSADPKDQLSRLDARLQDCGPRRRDKLLHIFEEMAELVTGKEMEEGEAGGAVGTKDGSSEGVSGKKDESSGAAAGRKEGETQGRGQ